MARSVRVNLEADVGKFKEPMRSAKESVDSLHDKVEQLDHSLDKIPADAAKAAAAMKLLKGDVGEAEIHFKELGDSSAGMTILQQRIKETRSEVKKLTEEFVKTGDVDVFHKLGKAQGELTELNNLRKKLSTAVEGGLKEGLEDGVAKAGPKAASTFSQLFQGGIIKALSNPAVLTAVGIIGVPLAAMLLAAIGGAITGAVALGVVGAGIAGAVMGDPKRIGAEWDKQISALKTKFISASASFVDPTIAGIRQIGKAVQSIDLEGIFKRASAFVGPLSNGLSRFIPSLGRMIEAFISGAGPVIDKIAEKLPQIGQALETFAKDVTGDSNDAADALGRVIDVIDGIIVGTGKIIHAAELVWGALRKTNDSVEDFMRHMQRTNGLFTALFTVPLSITSTWRAALAQGTENFQQFGKDAADALSKVPDAAATAASSLKEDIKSIDDAFSNIGKSVEGELTNKILDRMFAMADATISWEESLAKLDDTAKKNGTSLDILNEKTGKYNDKALDNEKALLAAAKANAQVYQQNLLSGMSADQAAAAYAANSEELRKQAINAGFNAKEVDGLIGKYADVPNEVKTILVTQGLTNALSHLSQILIDFNTLDKKSFVTKYYVETYFNTYGGRSGGEEAAHHALPPGHRAGGGPVSRGQPYIVGEQGPEMFLPTRDGVILPADVTRQIAPSSIGRSTAAPWTQGGGTTTFVHVLRIDGGNNGLVNQLQYLQRSGQLQFVTKAELKSAVGR